MIKESSTSRNGSAWNFQVSLATELHDDRNCILNLLFASDVPLRCSHRSVAQAETEFVPVRLHDSWPPAVCLTGSTNGLNDPVLQNQKIARKMFKMCEQGRL